MNAAPQRLWGAGLLVAALCLGIVFAGRAAFVGAVYFDSAATDADFGADVLDPATNLGASGVDLSQVTLNWTATPDTYATGYRIMRSTNGGAYSEINTVTPYTNTTYVDAVGGIGASSYSYYVVAYHEAWNSVASNTVTCTQVVVVFVCV
jgi:hypothetical protein